MTEPRDHAPSDVSIRRAPIDLPGDFGADNENRGTLAVVIIAGLILLAVVIGAAVLIGALA